MNKAGESKKYEILQYWAGAVAGLVKEIKSDEEYQEMRHEQERLKADGIIDYYVIKEVTYNE